MLSEVQQWKLNYFHYIELSKNILFETGLLSLMSKTAKNWTTLSEKTLFHCFLYFINVYSH